MTITKEVVAVAADTELRRRDLLRDDDQLRSAEREAFTYDADGEPDEDQARHARPGH
jgi:hypothetical protein